MQSRLRRRARGEGMDSVVLGSKGLYIQYETLPLDGDGL